MSDHRADLRKRKLIDPNTIIIIIYSVFVIIAAPSVSCEDIQPIRISLTVNAINHHLEVQWSNVPSALNATILITQQPVPADDHFINNIAKPNDINDDHRYTIENGAGEPSVRPSELWIQNYTSGEPLPLLWGTTSGIPVQYVLPVNTPNGWQTTTEPFHYEAWRTLHMNTTCYGFWATVVDSASGVRLAETCMRAHPTWMNEMRSHISTFRMRDLFLVGTHDSGSYRYRFHPKRNETRVTKYTLTQDDDIMGQLMHGVRYLDIRMGNYRKDSADSHQFWVNHGISRQQPLDEVLRQLRDFVTATNEIVIFDVQEFPVGFNKPAIHRQLVYHLRAAIGDLLVSPNLTWDATLSQIWQSGANVILSYDNRDVVDEFHEILFEAVQQRWGDKQSVSDLKRYLAGGSFALITGRPVADMAEMTPTAWDVFADKQSGLRSMANSTNRELSHWYMHEFNEYTNIVAVDFVRGTNLMETCLKTNAKRSRHIISH